MAAGSCCAQLLWMRQTLKDYGVICDKVPLWCDNESAIKISLNPVQHFKTKHIEIRYHFIRDHIRWGEIELNYVNTLDNLADIFTKPLDETRFRELRHELNIIDLSNVAWTRAHPTILNLLSCLGVRMDIGGVLFSQWTFPPLIMHKSINSFTFAILDGTCASKMNFGHGPKVNIFAVPYQLTPT